MTGIIESSVFGNGPDDHGETGIGGKGLALRVRKRALENLRHHHTSRTIPCDAAAP